mmetsp:Transcript_79416/g.97156  ORF Transcript_79416/g.97156 Transcript_79416/m.97156 type:complete len:245 (-) Transcript_79416:40-774(-)
MAHQVWKVLAQYRGEGQPDLLPGLLPGRQPVRDSREGPVAAGLRRGHEAPGDDAARRRHEGNRGTFESHLLVEVSSRGSQHHFVRRLGQHSSSVGYPEGHQREEFVELLHLRRCRGHLCGRTTDLDRLLAHRKRTANLGLRQWKGGSNRGLGKRLLEESLHALRSAVQQGPCKQYDPGWRVPRERGQVLSPTPRCRAGAIWCAGVHAEACLHCGLVQSRKVCSRGQRRRPSAGAGSTLKANGLW